MACPENASLSALPITDDVLIPAHELPRYLGIARQTLARWRHEGQGPKFVRLGRRVAYRSGDVRHWVGSCVHTNTKYV